MSDSHDVDATIPGNTLSADTLEGIDIDPRLIKAAEAMIFAADEPVPPHRIAEIFAEVTGRMQPDLATVEAHVRALNQEYQSTGRPLVIHEWAGGYRITTRPEMSPFVKALVVGEQETSLSRSLLETLAVLAYRQPVTRPEVDFVRGVNSDYAIRKLLDLGLADVKGRSESLGRPLLYGTTDRFLEQFGLNTLEDLPTLREIEDLLDDPTFDEERSQLLQLDTEKEITDRETAKEVLSEAREMVQKGELDADDFIDVDQDPGSGSAGADRGPSEEENAAQEAPDTTAEAEARGSSTEDASPDRDQSSEQKRDDPDASGSVSEE
ncbi:SMC-Scp complex subunit ScpB [Longibacter sp.]|uniref:SMC-Scp complex subunit ScpB n=1 Tax=Longibacter sp. TaxID=2045415 RepID=UPI003EBE6CB0